MRLSFVCPSVSGTAGAEAAFATTSPAEDDDKSLSAAGGGLPTPVVALVLDGAAETSLCNCTCTVP